MDYYSICGHDQKQNFHTSAKVRNLAVRASWAYVEPSQGVFAWDAIDVALSALPSDGLASLAIHAGSDTPAWLLNQVPTINSGGTIYPAPWNNLFQYALNTLIAAAGARYGNNKRISRVCVPALCGASLETNLRNVGATLAQWQAVGYTATTALVTFEENISFIQTCFSQPVVSAWQPGNGGLNFDPINGQSTIAAMIAWFAEQPNVIQMNAGANPNWVMVFPDDEKVVYQESKACGNQVDFNSLRKLATDAGAESLEIYSGDILFV